MTSSDAHDHPHDHDHDHDHDRTFQPDIEDSPFSQYQVMVQALGELLIENNVITADELREDGFFITGDLGKIDEDGYVHIVGRNKDLIISGGYNIYPKEIELILDEQPGVLESAVIGVPHPDFGETVVGVMVAENGQSPDMEEIMNALRRSLARFKHPRRLVILNELPRNTMGKVQKNILRDQYQGMFTSEEFSL